MHLLFIAASLAALAAEPDRSRDFVESHLSERTLAIVRIDVTRAGPTVTALSNGMFADVELPLQVATEPLLKLASAAAEAGVKHAYFIVDDLSPRSMSFLIVLPLAEKMADDKVAALVNALSARLGESELHQTDDAIYLGTPGRYEEATATRAGLADAFAVFGATPLALAVVPSPDQKRVLAELTPLLAAEEIQLSLRRFLGDMDWMAAAYSPGESLYLVVKTDSPELAAASEKTLRDIIATLQRQQDDPAAKDLPVGLMAITKSIVDGDRLVLNLGQEDTVALERFARAEIGVASASADRERTMNRFKQIGLGLHNAADTTRSLEGGAKFTDAASYDAEGKPLLSWRVHLLPYLGYDSLYREFDLNQPWDSDRNRKLIEKMPDVFRVGSSEVTRQGRTCIQLPLGEMTAFPDGKGLHLRQFGDGLAKTILAVEVDDKHAVIWTEPKDFEVDFANPAQGLGGHFDEVFHVTIGDGSVRALNFNTDPAVLRALLTPNGGEVLAPK